MPLRCIKVSEINPVGRSAHPRAGTQHGAYVGGNIGD